MGAELVVALLCVAALIQEGHCIYGYDCANKLTNLTTLSLVDIGECETRTNQANAITIKAQLIQVNDYNIIHAKECQVKIKRTVHHCGMHSHTSAALYGEIEYYKKLTRDECEGIQLTGTFNGFGLLLMHIKRNSTTTRPVVLAGKLDKNAGCESGAAYDDPYESFTDVLVTGYVSIGIYDYDMKLNLESDKVLMQDGTPCSAKARHCISGEGGNVYWDALPEKMCGANKYAVLYEGFMNEISDPEDKNVMYVLDTHDYSFALVKTIEETICGVKFIHTEVSRFLIIEEPRSNHLLQKQEVATANVDIFAFINAKALFLEKHLKGQMKKMYDALMLDRCNLERKVIENALAIDTLQPSELAYQILGERGFMSLVVGEALHIVKCLGSKSK
ncbi:hypothetical protein TKK_0011624 [Trichogramma kaykai]